MDTHLESTRGRRSWSPRKGETCRFRFWRPWFGRDSQGCSDTFEGWPSAPSTAGRQQSLGPFKFRYLDSLFEGPRRREDFGHTPTWRAETSSQNAKWWSMFIKGWSLWTCWCSLSLVLWIEAGFGRAWFCCLSFWWMFVFLDHRRSQRQTTRSRCLLGIHVDDGHWGRRQLFSWCTPTAQKTVQLWSI